MKDVVIKLSFIWFEMARLASYIMTKFNKKHESNKKRKKTELRLASVISIYSHFVELSFVGLLPSTADVGSNQQCYFVLLKSRHIFFLLLLHSYIRLC